DQRPGDDAGAVRSARRQRGPDPARLRRTDAGVPLPGRRAARLGAARENLHPAGALHLPRAHDRDLHATDHSDFPRFPEFQHRLSPVTPVAFAAFNVVLLCAAVSDLRRYRIPNALPALLALAAVVLA